MINKADCPTSKAPQAPSSLKLLIVSAFFAALTAVFSQIALPLPFTPVPINLATLSVFLAGSLLGPRYGAASQLIYLGLGLVGVPVFSQFTGGPAIVLGPTGGYIIGYALAALTIGVLFERSASPRRRPLPEILFYAVGLLACYIPGTLWFMFQTQTPLLPSLTLCVFPFLPGDGIKIAAAFLVSRRLRPALRRV